MTSGVSVHDLPVSVQFPQVLWFPPKPMPIKCPFVIPNHPILRLGTNHKQSNIGKMTRIWQVKHDSF